MHPITSRRFLVIGWTFVSSLSLSGCFADAGLAAAHTATLQANAAKNAVKVKDDSIKKINDTLAAEAQRNAQLLTQVQQQAESPEAPPDTSK